MEERPRPLPALTPAGSPPSTSSVPIPSSHPGVSSTGGTTAVPAAGAPGARGSPFGAGAAAVGATVQQHALAPASPGTAAAPGGTTAVTYAGGPVSSTAGGSSTVGSTGVTAGSPSAAAAGKGGPLWLAQQHSARSALPPVPAPVPGLTTGTTPASPAPTPAAGQITPSSAGLQVTPPSNVLPVTAGDAAAGPMTQPAPPAAATSDAAAAGASPMMHGHPRALTPSPGVTSHTGSSGLGVRAVHSSSDLPAGAVTQPAAGSQSPPTDHQIGVGGGNGRGAAHMGHPSVRVSSGPLVVVMAPGIEEGMGMGAGGVRGEGGGVIGSQPSDSTGPHAVADLRGGSSSSSGGSSGAPRHATAGSPFQSATAAAAQAAGVPPPGGAVPSVPSVPQGTASIPTTVALSPTAALIGATAGGGTWTGGQVGPSSGVHVPGLGRRLSGSGGGSSLLQQFSSSGRGSGPPSGAVARKFSIGRTMPVEIEDGEDDEGEEEEGEEGEGEEGLPSWEAGEGEEGQEIGEEGELGFD